MTKALLLNPKLFLTVIFILFLVTRLYKISEIPASLYWDEASIGYNAYSIAETGRDEWGKFLPLHFRAFGEFKLPVYIYTVALFVKLIGLNEFSIRLPAVLFSLGIVILVYVYGKKFFKSSGLGLLSSFFITISPWFFIFSRTGYEATAGLLFYLLAIYFFLEHVKNIWYILISALTFILSIYSYNSFRVIVPLTIVILTIYELKNLRNNFNKLFLPIIFSVIILIISIIPIYRLYIFDTGFSRLQSVGSFKTAIIKNYFSHFSLNYLLLHGANNQRSQQKNFGDLYLSEFLFLLLGLIYIIKSKSKNGLFILSLLFLGPIPAAITKESPHALRAISTVPFISLVSAQGVLYFKKYFKGRYITETVVVIISLSFFINYFINFLVHYPIQSSSDWQYSYKVLFSDSKYDFSKYNRVIISDEYAQPYIFALFYQKIDPNKFSQNVIRNSVDQWGFSTVKSFNKFIFSKVKTDNVPSGKNLIFASPNEKLTGIANKDVILNLDNSVAFYVYEYDK